MSAPVILLKAIDYSGSGSWLDQSPEGNDATLETGTIAKNAQGNGIVLDGSTSWTFPDVNVGNAFSVNVWYKNVGGIPAGVQQQYAVLTQIYGLPDNVNIFIGSLTFNRSTMAVGSYYGNNIYDSIRSYITVGEWINIQGTWDGTTMKTYINSCLISSTALGITAASSGLAYRIGRGWNPENTSYLTGEIGEVRIYNYARTELQVSTDYEESVGTFLWQPTDLTNLHLWMDGNDDTTMTFSGSTVTQWNDKSGSGRNTTGITGTPTFTDGEGVVFDGSSRFNLPNGALPFGNSSYSIYAVVKYDTFSSSPFIKGGEETENMSLGIQTDTTTGDVRTFWWTNDISATVSITQGDPFLCGSLYQSGAQRTLFIFGSAAGSDTPGTRSQPNTGNILGTTMTGSISEIVVYNVNHNTQQRQTVEGYLAWKWNLQSDLPVNHPYYGAPPNPPAPSALTIPRIYIRPATYPSSAQIWWQQPVSTGGSALSTYMLSCLDQTFTTMNFAYPATQGLIPALNQLSSYTFQLVATNMNGDTSPIATYRTIRPDNRPLRPTAAEATAMTEAGTTTVSWTPATNSSLLGYAIVLTPVTSGDTVSLSAVAEATSVNVIGLTTTSAYNCSIWAVNDAGWSQPPATTAQIPIPSNQAFSIAGSTSGTGNVMMYSYDGINWTLTPTSPFTGALYGAAWNGTMWVAGGVAGGAAPGPQPRNLAYSYDGINWTASSSGNSVLTGNCAGVAWNGTLWVAGGWDFERNQFAYSSDGINWTALTSATALITSAGYCVAWNGSRWVAGGRGTGTIGTYTTMIYSDDGINWTASSSIVFTNTCLRVAWGGSKWVAVGFGACQIAYSSDGINWTASTSGNDLITSIGYSVAWNGTIWLVGGQGTNTIIYSSDGINWNISNSIFSTACYTVTWNGSIWVAGGQGTNKVAYSSDGINWTASTSGNAILSTECGNIISRVVLPVV